MYVQTRTGFHVKKPALFGSKKECQRYCKAARIGKINAPIIKVKAITSGDDEVLYAFLDPSKGELREGHLFQEVTVNNEEVFLGEGRQLFEDQASLANAAARRQMKSLTGIDQLQNMKLKHADLVLERFFGQEQPDEGGEFGNEPDSDMQPMSEGSDEDAIDTASLPSTVRQPRTLSRSPRALTARPVQATGSVRSSKPAASPRSSPARSPTKSVAGSVVGENEDDDTVARASGDDDENEVGDEDLGEDPDGSAKF